MAPIAFRFLLTEVERTPLLEAIELYNASNDTDFELSNYEAKDRVATLVVSPEVFRSEQLFELGAKYMMMRQTSL